MKSLFVVLIASLSFNALASDYCNISFTTEWSARKDAPQYAKSMVKHKKILEEKGYHYVSVSSSEPVSFNLDIYEHDIKQGKVGATFTTPKGEYFTYTQENLGFERTVKGLFQMLPECIDI